jgi:hypothetical protein
MSSLLHSSQPSIKLKSQKLLAQIRNERPFSDQPPSKRPHLATMTGQRRCMSTYAETDLRRLLWANDESAINEIQEELLHSGLEWALSDDSLLVPLCKEDEECSICDTYHTHLMRRMARDDDADPSDDEDPPEPMDTDSRESEEPEVEFKSQSMQKLFKLRNLQTRLEAYQSDDAHSIGQFQGMVVQLNYEKVRAEGDRDHANSAWAVADAQLETLKQSHQTLTESYDDLKRAHELAVEEIRVLKQQLEDGKHFL